MTLKPTSSSGRRATSGLALALACLLALALPALAIEGEGFTLSDASPEVQRDYPPIAGNDPSAQVLVPTIANCRDLPGNVLIPIGMDFSRDFGHVLEIVVDWPAAEANDIDIYFFDESGEVIADSASADPQESVRLGSLANGQYYLCVRNFSGANAGFTLDAAVRFVAVFTRTPEPPTDAPPTTTPARTSAQATPQPGAGELKQVDEVTADPVSTPGPDGPFSDRGLVAVAGSRQASPDEGGLSVAQMVLLGLTGLVAVGGVGLVALRIRRDLKG